MVTLIGGRVGGLVATIGTSVVMKAMGGGPPPTAALLAKFRGGEPEAHEKPGMALHLVYGTVAGAALVAVVSAVAPGVTSLTAWLGIGLAYGILLLLGGAIGWVEGVIGMEPDTETTTGFAVVYGLVLGAWLGLGVLGWRESPNNRTDGFHGLQFRRPERARAAVQSSSVWRSCFS